MTLLSNSSDNSSLSKAATTVVNQDSFSGKIESTVGTPTTTINTTTSAANWNSTAVESIKAVSYMRARSIRYSAVGCKPNTRMYAFFDDIPVNSYCTQYRLNDSNVITEFTDGTIITDGNGAASGMFNCPGNKFQIGSRIFKLSTNVSGVSDGVSDGDTVAVFQSIGFEQTVRTATNVLTSNTTTTNTVKENVITYTPPKPADVISFVQEPCRTDPIAQSFNTYGVKDGLFVTSITLFFKSKSSVDNVFLEIRTMQTGFPTTDLVSPDSYSVKLPVNVNISDDASVGTTFSFPAPIYLEPNSDFCFVVKSNSKDYNLFVSEMGKISLETGKMIDRQPFVGSLFKSENNYTWSPEQFKDVKFIINRAKFNNTSFGVINSVVEPVPIYISTGSIITTAGSRVIKIITTGKKHGFDTSSKVHIKTHETTGASYNGFTFANLTGEFPVTKIISDTIFECILPTGTCTESGRVQNITCVGDISIVSGGRNYTSPTVQINGSGTGAAASVTVERGIITKITVTNHGTGYTSTPTVVITDPTGTGAAAVVNISETVLVSLNSVANVLSTYTPVTTISGTSATAEITLTDVNYVRTSTVPYNFDNVNVFDMNAIIASRYNESSRMGNNDSCVLNYTLVSTSDFVSPIVDFTNAAATSFAYNINYLENETIDRSCTDGSAIVESCIIGNGGNYTEIPTIYFSAPASGVAAIGFVILSGGTTGTITEIVLVNNGYGYTSTPSVSISGNGGGIVVPVLSKFNSELTPYSGNALARYISNKTVLATISASATAYVEAYSHAKSSFEVYIRTSLSTDDTVHDDRGWSLMHCDVSRDKSVKADQFLEYKFTVNDLQEFDTFDVKIVLRSKDAFNPPIISNYRLITTV